MSEKHTHRRNYWSCVGLIALLMVLVCGGVYAFFYYSLRYEYDRAAGIAGRVLGDVEQLYAELGQNTPPEATLTDSKLPSSGLMHFALSDGAPQYALVWAQQNYTTALNADSILEYYDTYFADNDWAQVTLDGDPGSIRRAYAYPNDDRLWVGICGLNPGELSGATEYTIFFDFSEYPGGVFCPDRACVIVHEYCGGYE